MVKKDYLHQFQVFLRNQIPEVIILILRKSGYDSALAIESLNDNEIIELETYVNGREDVIAALKNTVYEKVIPFKFLPGHKALFAALRKKLMNLKKPNRK